MDKGEKKRIIQSADWQNGACVGENVLAVYHFESLCLPVSFMQSHGRGECRRQGRGRRTDGHQALQRMRGHRRWQRGDGWKHGALFPIQNHLRATRQARLLHDAEVVLVLVVRAAVAQVCDLQVRVRLRVLLDPSSSLRGTLSACPSPGPEADRSQAHAEAPAWGIGLYPLPIAQRGPDLCPTHREAPRVGRQAESDRLTARRAVRPSSLARRSPLACTRLPGGKHGGEGVRQLGEATLQRAGVKLRGVEGAGGQFGAVIEGEGPWEVGVEAPGVVEGWVTWVGPQQGRRFGVARGPCERKEEKSRRAG